MGSLRQNWIMFSVATLLGLAIGISAGHLGMGEHDDSCSVCDLAQHFAALNPDVVVPTVELRVVALPSSSDRIAGSHDPVALAQPRAPPAS
jgi:hypothetical protein